RDVPPDVLIGRVAKHVELSLVCPEDCTARTDPMDSFRRIFKEVAEGPLAALERRLCAALLLPHRREPALHFFPVGERRLQRVRALLQDADLERLRVAVGIAELFGWKNAG